MPNSFESEQGDTSPPSLQDASSTAKRRRIALACLDCRRRKLRCDRLFPTCTRCQKGGHASTCTYDPDAAETLANGGVSPAGRSTSNGVDKGSSGLDRTTLTSFAHHHQLDSDDSVVGRMQMHIHQLENRIVGLERITNGPGYQVDPAQPVTTTSRSIPQDHGPEPGPGPEPERRELMMFRGKHYKTAFYGTSHHTSLLSQMHDLRKFMKEMDSVNPQLVRVQRELKVTKCRKPMHEDDLTTEHILRQLLPSKETADTLIKLYIETFESTYRILHIPTFREQYIRLWASLDDAQPFTIVMVLLMCASMNCIRGEESALFRGDSSLSRETACRWISVCESWLASESQKHLQLWYLQCQCLIFLAKRMNSVKRKRTWTSIGTLLSFAVSIGLHRDAEYLNFGQGHSSKRRVSHFDQEMRRRLWSTISELELQTAVDRGMPVTLPDLKVDCGTPANVDDEDITPDMLHRPQSKPIKDYTYSSFQHLMANTWHLRKSLVSLINGCHPHPDYDATMRYDRMLRQSLDNIPEWAEPSASFARRLSVLCYQELLVHLHRPYVKFKASHYSYSSIAHLEATKSILEMQYTLLQREVPVFGIFRQDTVGAALNICYNHISRQESAPSNVLPGVDIDLLSHLEHALEMIEDKIMRLGIGIQEYYAICACIGLLSKSRGVADGKSQEFQAAQRVAKQIQRMLSMEDKFDAAATLASLPKMPIISPSYNRLSNGDTILTTNDDNTIPSLIPFDGLQDLDLNVQAWDFDNFFDF